MTSSPTAEPAWCRMVRRRLLAGEAITGSQIRQDVGRRVAIYSFLRHLETNEGWVFKQTLIPGRTPIMQYKLAGYCEPEPPHPTGPRTNLPKDERPTAVIMRRLLSGKKLENQVIAEELGCTSSALTYVKHRLEDMGYEVMTERVGYRVFTKVKKKGTR